MTRPSDSMIEHTSEQAWSERNQRWLSSRLAFWRERIRTLASGAETEPTGSVPAAPGDGFEPAALRVSALFGLSAFETELLVLAAGVEIDDALREAVAGAQGTAPGRPVRLGFALALALLPQPHWDALSPLGPLRYWSLAGCDTSMGLSQTALRVDERVLHYLTGVAAFDELLFGIARLEDGASDARAQELAIRVARALAGRREPMVMLADAMRDGVHKRAARSLACEVFRQMGLRMLWVETPALSGDAHELLDTARRIDREATLDAAGVALALEADPVHGALAMRLVGALRSPVVLLGAPGPLLLADLPAREPLRFNTPLPAAAAHAALPLPLKRAAERALQQFRVEGPLFEQALDAVAGIEDEDAVDVALWQALRETARGGLDTLAQRIDSRASFDDLVVPPFVAAQLREIASQLRHRQTVYDEWGFAERQGRGLGIAALFAGESGTGKTLAAEAIANEARLDLYRIDLASVVNKYIGETEKNLSRLFDASEASGAVLLFDEADALFGKRSEVRDSHDRYANIEVAYLLQRIESYRGLAILTTNMKSALDRAFLRRIRFIVQFPFPDAPARAAIWRRQFPRAAPMGEVDFAGLSRLQLTGGSIRAVAINAAFKAADRDRDIDHGLLVEAAGAEHAKLERMMGDAAARGAR